MSGIEVCALDDIADGAAKRLAVGDVQIAVVRIGETVYAINDICSHANVSLSGGDVWCDELELECPKHGSVFNLETGQPGTLPATQPVAVYKASVIEGKIVVDVGQSEVGA